MSIANVYKQTITPQYALYCGDCMDILKGVPAESVGFSIFSPPFFSTCTHTAMTPAT